MIKSPPPSKSSKPSLPALDRGLAILDLLIRAGGGPLRFGELRAHLSGVQDSTLARILKSLEGYGYIERDADTGYRLSTRVLGWRAYLNGARPALADLARREVDRLAREGHESACIAMLGEEKIEVLCSHSVKDGIRIIQPGDTLHFEPDHAGSLSILEQLPPDERERYLAGPFSRFDTGVSVETCLAKTRRCGPALIDHSQARPGICRLARAFRHNGQLGTVFFGLTEQALSHEQLRLTSLLESACQRLEE
jgi:DNA-binding IclR family transcriptional regulator